MQRSRADGIVCARTIDASNDVLAAAEGWAHCGHPSKRDCRQRAGILTGATKIRGSVTCWTPIVAI